MIIKFPLKILIGIILLQNSGMIITIIITIIIIIKKKWKMKDKNNNNKIIHNQINPLNLPSQTQGLLKLITITMLCLV